MVVVVGWWWWYRARMLCVIFLHLLLAFPVLIIVLLYASPPLLLNSFCFSFLLCKYASHKATPKCIILVRYWPCHFLGLRRRHCTPLRRFCWLKQCQRAKTCQSSQRKLFCFFSLFIEGLFDNFLCCLLIALPEGRKREEGQRRRL